MSSHIARIGFWIHDKPSARALCSAHPTESMLVSWCKGAVHNAHTTMQQLMQVA